MNKITTYCFLLFLAGSLSSCLAHRELVNFSEGTTFPETISNAGALRLQPDDLLDIRVFNSNDLDQTAAQPYNLEQRSNAGGEDARANIYRIDEQGQIVFPGIGQVPVTGLTLSEARDTLSQRLKVYLNAPIVNIRMLNFRITVLGEVRSPNTFSVDAPRVNVLEALGMAGDLTNYGRRDNILVIREENGKRSVGAINLKSKDAFNSPYFQLKQHDIVYVEPLKQKTGSVSDQSSKILPWVSIGSVALNILLFLAR
jgi:polysaccharide export outer membrane protein